MKSRREFVKNGTLAATALMVANPLELLANASAPLSGFNNGNNFLFIYTANLSRGNYSGALQFVQRAQQNAKAILLDAGTIAPAQNNSLDHDLSFLVEGKLPAGDYRIIDKGNIRTGIISVIPGGNDILQKTDQLAAYLKKEKNCQVVVCLSQLGYKNKRGADDLSLAARSKDLDIIIGVHPKNPSIRPVVAFNRDKREVFIHPVVAGKFAIGKIEIGFDRQGHKRFIDLVNELPVKKNRETAVA